MAGPRPQRNRGTPIHLPAWWMEALRRLTAGQSAAELAEKLNKISAREPPWRRETVHLFLTGKVTTIEMMYAFLKVFGDDLPPPMLFARSYEEAARLNNLSKTFDAPPRAHRSRTDDTDPPRLSKTDEDFDAVYDVDEPTEPKQPAKSPRLRSVK